MEAIEKNNASNTHQEKAKKLRKLRRWQIAVSLLGAADRAVHIPYQPTRIRLYQEDLFYRTSRGT